MRLGLQNFMKIRLSIILLAVLLFMPPLADGANRGWKNISSDRLQQMMREGAKPILINTMSQIECFDHSIAGSACIPYEEFEKRINELPAKKDTAIILYCESMGLQKSIDAADIAAKYGYTNVFVLEGGIPAWKRAGYELVSIERIPRKPIPALKPPAVRQLLTERKNLLLLDIRSEKLYREGHIEGAVNIPMYQLHIRYAELPIDRFIFLVDSRGLCTFLAASYLTMKGFETRRLFGGMAKWDEMLSKEKKNKKRVSK